jgi:hypothetical protein
MTFLWLVWHNGAGGNALREVDELSLNSREEVAQSLVEGAVRTAEAVLPYFRAVSDRQALPCAQGSESPW